MSETIRMSLAKYKVLRELLRAPADSHYGYALMRDTGVKSGSLYPILEQLERVGWLEARWEQVNEQTHGRPPRRWYRLTGKGEKAARAATTEYAASLPTRSSAPRRRPRPALEPGG
jgi:DNA-binding PadR family transcriptional regulator